MNEKEVAELRRQLKRDRNNITKVYGCYVNENRSIVSTFSQSLALATDEEADAYLNLLKKSLSGTLGKNLIDIAFSNQQVIGSEEHGLLMKLRETKLEDEELLQKFYDKVISCVSLEENYLILIACNAYDVPYKAKDDTELSDGSEEMFTHLLCSIAPVKKASRAWAMITTSSTFTRLPEIGWLHRRRLDFCSLRLMTAVPIFTTHCATPKSRTIRFSPLSRRYSAPMFQNRLPSRKPALKPCCPTRWRKNAAWKSCRPCMNS